MRKDNGDGKDIRNDSAETAKMRKDSGDSKEIAARANR